jgi:hypothetical protein
MYDEVNDERYMRDREDRNAAAYYESRGLTQCWCGAWVKDVQEHIKRSIAHLYDREDAK